MNKNDLPENNPNRVTSLIPVKCDDCSTIIPPAVNYFIVGNIIACAECFRLAAETVLKAQQELNFEWPVEIDIDVQS